MKSTAIVLAAGRGNRLGAEIPKQYIEVDGRPLLYYSLAAFEQSRVDGMVIVCGAGDESYVQEEIVTKYGLPKVQAVTAGGAERYDSVLCGLRVAEADYVLIHDGARPFITAQAIDRILEEVVKYDAVVAGMPVKDTIKIVDEDDFVRKTTERRLTWQIQTPQAFRYDLIRRAYERVIGNMEDPLAAAQITDDAMVFTRAFPERKVKLVPAGYENSKVTTPEDLDLARWRLEGKN